MKVYGGVEVQLHAFLTSALLGYTLVSVLPAKSRWNNLGTYHLYPDRGSMRQNTLYTVVI